MTSVLDHLVVGDGVITVDSEIRQAMNMSTEELTKKHNPDACEEDECMLCSIVLCPHKEPLHLHHDGCPACD